MTMTHDDITAKMEAIIAEMSKGEYDAEEQTRLDSLRQRWEELQAKYLRDELAILMLTVERERDDELFAAYLKEVR